MLSRIKLIQLIREELIKVNEECGPSLEKNDSVHYKNNVPVVTVPHEPDEEYHAIDINNNAGLSKEEALKAIIAIINDTSCHATRKILVDAVKKLL